MTCHGCHKSERKGAPGVRESNAVMCLTCPSLSLTETHCLVSQEPVWLHIMGKPCPRLRHLQDGVVRWLGMRWYGVPWPIRVWRWRKSKKRWIDFGRQFVGCGCFKWPKDLYENALAVRDWFRFAMMY